MKHSIKKGQYIMFLGDNNIYYVKDTSLHYVLIDNGEFDTWERKENVDFIVSITIHRKVDLTNE